MGPGATMCEQSYGVLPCSDNLVGAAFLMFVYGYLTLLGANMIGDGGEHLLSSSLNWAPSVVGGLVLPVIGALPDSIIILIAGLHGTRSVAKEQVAIGMGTLAGSTVMLLTIVFGGSILAGRCDLTPQGLQRDGRLSRGWDLMGTGVSTDRETPKMAWAMILSSLLYLVVEIPALMGWTKDPKAALAGSILCFITLLGYCLRQALTPEVRRRRILAAHKHYLRCRAVRSIAWWSAERCGGILESSDEGTGHAHNGWDGPRVNRKATSSLFARFDRDASGGIDREELRHMLIGLEIAKGEDADETQLAQHVALWMREFDADGDGSISADEFHAGIEKWVAYKLRRVGALLPPKKARDPAQVLTQLPDDDTYVLAVPLLREQAGRESDGSAGTDDEETDHEAAVSGAASSSDSDSDDPPREPWQVLVSAALSFLMGCAVCVVFADPFVEAVAAFARCSGIPAFFVSFVVAPLASNASELVSSIRFAQSRRSRHISTTFNQVYGAVVMNNTMCAGLFMLVVYMRRLQWTYTSEVLCIMLPTLAITLLATRGRTIRTVWALPILGAYPLVLFLQFLLKHVLGVA